VSPLHRRSLLDRIDIVLDASQLVISLRDSVSIAISLEGRCVPRESVSCNLLLDIRPFNVLGEGRAFLDVGVVYVPEVVRWQVVWFLYAQVLLVRPLLGHDVVPVTHWTIVHQHFLLVQALQILLIVGHGLRVSRDRVVPLVRLAVVVHNLQSLRIERVQLMRVNHDSTDHAGGGLRVLEVGLKEVVFVLSDPEFLDAGRVLVVHHFLVDVGPDSLADVRTSRNNGVTARLRWRDLAVCEDSMLEGHLLLLLQSFLLLVDLLQLELSAFYGLLIHQLGILLRRYYN